MGHQGRKSAIYGDAVTGDGRGLPMTVESHVGLVDKAGIEPQQLDSAVQSLISIVDGGSALLLSNAPMLEKLMKALQKEVDRVMESFEVEAERAALSPPSEQSKPGLTVAIAVLLDLTARVSIVLDRVDKMVMNAVKAKDMVVRLRTFIATGDEHDRGLDGMSENQLRKMINATARGEDVPELDRNG